MILASVVNYLKRLRSSTYVDPVRDWILLIAVSVVAFIGIVLWNVWVFNSIQQSATETRPAGTSPTSNTSRSTLDTLNAVFTSRGAEQQKYISGEYHYTDPSL